MEQILEKIALNTEPKNSLQIVVSDNKTRFKTKFNPPIQLDKKKRYQIALVNLETYYSFPNIDSTKKHFRYSPDDGKSWFDIHIPEGCYEITDINDYIQLMMRQNGHYSTVNEVDNIILSANINTLKLVMILAEKYQVDFRPLDSTSSVLGFNNDLYTSRHQESENVVNILR